MDRRFAIAKVGWLWFVVCEGGKRGAKVAGGVYYDCFRGALLGFRLGPLG